MWHPLPLEGNTIKVTFDEIFVDNAIDHSNKYAKPVTREER
jgi:hypothetical protein